MKLRVLCLSLCLIAPTLAQQQAANERKQMMSPPHAFALQRVGQVAIRVKDLNRAVAFYRDKLGLSLQLEAPSLALFDCGGLTLLLSLPESAAEGVHNSLLYFDVADIQQAVQALTERNVPLVEKPNKVGKLGTQEVWIAIFRDSEENLMGLRSMVAAQ